MTAQFSIDNKLILTGDPSEVARLVQVMSDLASGPPSTMVITEGPFGTAINTGNVRPIASDISQLDDRPAPKTKPKRAARKSSVQDK